MNVIVLNDWHIGAVRTGGTTQATAYTLRQNLLKGLMAELDQINGDILFNGDLFDGPAISTTDLLRTFQLLSDYLKDTEADIYLSNGNHDLSKNSTVLSSFQLLAKLLIDVHGADRVIHIEKGQMTPFGYVIPHVANQDIFDLELAAVPACDYLFVHCNYDNEFAVEADHSLNLSRAQAEALPVKHIVFGHEHQARTELGGKVIVVGNQVPSSIADCLNNDFKRMFDLSNGVHGFHMTWQAEGDFSQQDWRDLNDIGRFIRVTGTATAAEAAQVITALAKFRSTAKALVITNAVKIEGQDDTEALTLSVEQISSFNVLGALLDILTPEEGVKVTKLLEKRNVAKT